MKSLDVDESNVDTLGFLCYLLRDGKSG